MGAYENPAMIRQTAGLYWARAIESIGQSASGAISTIFEEQKKQAEEERKRREAQALKRSSMMVNSWQSLEDLRAGTIKAMGPNASDLMIENVNSYVSENGQMFVEKDAQVKGGFGTPEEQKSALEFSTNFKTTAGKKVNAAKNYESTLAGYSEAMANNNEYNFVDDDAEFAWSILSNKTAGVRGINGYDANIDENDKGDNILTLKVNGVDRNINSDLDDRFFDENGNYTYSVNLNKLDKSQVFVKALPGVDSAEIARSTGVANEQNILNEQKAGVITKGNIERTYYTSSAFGDALAKEINATVDSWFAVNDSRTINEIRGQLRAWGLNKTEVANFVNEPEGIDAIKAKMLQREFNKVYSGNKSQAAVIPATPDIIAEIKEINRSRPEGAKLDVPNPGDLIGYSQRAFQTAATTLTDAQRKNLTKAQIFDSLVVPDVENIYNTYQGDARADLYVKNLKQNNPDLDVVTAREHLTNMATVMPEIADLLKEGKEQEAARALGLESPIGVVYYNKADKEGAKTLKSYVPLAGDKNTVLKGMLMQTAKIYGLTQAEAAGQYVRYMQSAGAAQPGEVDEFAEFKVSN